MSLVGQLPSTSQFQLIVAQLFLLSSGKEEGSETRDIVAFDLSLE